MQKSDPNITKTSNITSKEEYEVFKKKKLIKLTKKTEVRHFSLDIPTNNLQMIGFSCLILILTNEPIILILIKCYYT